MDPLSAGIMAGGSILGGLIGGSSAKGAAKAQAAAAKAVFRQQTALTAPYRAAGNAAMNPLYALYGISTGMGGTPAGAATPEQQQAALDMFYQSPEMRIQRDAMSQALQRQAAAGGVRFSGNTALGEAEIASRTFGDWRNQLASLAALGPQAANIQSANLGAMGSNLSNAIGNLGAARSGMAMGFGQSIADIGAQIGQYRAQQNEMDMLRQLYSPVQMQPYVPPTGGQLQGLEIRF